jgi:hypothetical protein
MDAVGYFCILYLSESATTMPNAYVLELVIIAANHRGTRTAVELYATPCDVACVGGFCSKTVGTPLTPQRLQDCWEDAQTSEAGRTTLRKNTRL